MKNIKLNYGFAVLLVIMSYDVQDGSAFNASDRSLVDKAVKSVVNTSLNVLKINPLISSTIQSLDNFTENILNREEKLINLLHKLQKDVNVASYMLRKAANDSLEPLSTLTQRVLSQIGTVSGRFGVNISSCLSKYEKPISQIPQVFVNQELGCAQSEIDTINRLINETLNVTLGTQNQLLRLPSRLQECRSKTFPPTCISSVLSNVALSQVRLPKEISTLSFDATTFVSGFQARLEFCVSKQAAIVALNAGAVLSKAALCVMQKL